MDIKTHTETKMDIKTHTEAKLEPSLQQKVSDFLSEWDWKQTIKYTAIGAACAGVVLAGPTAIIAPFLIKGVPLIAKIVSVTSGVLQTSWVASMFSGSGKVFERTSLVNVLCSFPLFITGLFSIVMCSLPAPIIALIVYGWFFAIVPLFFLYISHAGCR